jgi:hypothetical protein
VSRLDPAALILDLGLPYAMVVHVRLPGVRIDVVQYLICPLQRSPELAVHLLLPNVTSDRSK